MNESHPSGGGDRRIDDGIERGRAVEIIVDGAPIDAFEGESIAAALFAAGVRTLRHTARRGAPRGFYCGMGVCFECVMHVDGRPNTRTCQTAVHDGMQVRSQDGTVRR
ncbi:MAG: (2Fe-2S)-binding protein [Ardenticatenales bacterium]